MPRFIFAIIFLFINFTLYATPTQPTRFEMLKVGCVSVTALIYPNAKILQICQNYMQNKCFIPEWKNRFTQLAADPRWGLTTCERTENSTKPRAFVGKNSMGLRKKINFFRDLTAQHLWYQLNQIGVQNEECIDEADKTFWDAKRQRNFDAIDSYVVLGNVPTYARYASIREVMSQQKAKIFSETSKRCPNNGGILTLLEPKEVFSLNQTFKDLGIDFLTRVTPDEWVNSGFTPKWISTPDHEALSPEVLLEAAEFIHKMRLLGCPVYVHCKAGKSRSALVVLLDQMLHDPLPNAKALQFSRSEATNLFNTRIRSKREQARFSGKKVDSLENFMAAYSTDERILNNLKNNENPKSLYDLIIGEHARKEASDDSTFSELLQIVIDKLAIEMMLSKENFNSQYLEKRIREVLAENWSSEHTQRFRHFKKNEESIVSEIMSRLKKAQKSKEKLALLSGEQVFNTAFPPTQEGNNEAKARLLRDINSLARLAIKNRRVQFNGKGDAVFQSQLSSPDGEPNRERDLLALQEAVKRNVLAKISLGEGLKEQLGEMLVRYSITQTFQANIAAAIKRDYPGMVAVNITPYNVPPMNFALDEKKQQIVVSIPRLLEIKDPEVESNNSTKVITDTLTVDLAAVEKWGDLRHALKRTFILSKASNN